MKGLQKIIKILEQKKINNGRTKLLIQKEEHLTVTRLAGEITGKKISKLLRRSENSFSFGRCILHSYTRVIIQRPNSNWLLYSSQILVLNYGERKTNRLLRMKKIPKF